MAYISHKKLSKLALDVAKLVRSPKVRKRFQEQVIHERDEQRATLRAIEDFDRRRNQHAKAILKDARLRDPDADPPEAGWQWASYLARLDTRDDAGTVIGCDHCGVEGWTPPNLLPTERPEERASLFCPSPGREVPLSGKYWALAAIHDGTLPGVRPVNPWAQSKKPLDGLMYRHDVERIKQIPPEMEPALRAWLGEVEADLRMCQLGEVLQNSAPPEGPWRARPGRPEREDGSMPSTQGGAAREFLTALEKLIVLVQQAEPGFEFDQADAILHDLNRTAPAMGSPYFAYRVLLGHRRRPEHTRVLQLKHPVSERDLDLPLYTFVALPLSEDRDMREERALDAWEAKAVREGRVQRHVTSREERARLLTWLRAWREEIASRITGQTVANPLPAAPSPPPTAGDEQANGKQVPTEPEPADRLKPSHARAKALYEWATEHINGAGDMTYAEVFDALKKDTRCEGEGLPDNAEAFGRYCRAAGIRRNTPRRAKGATRSVRRASEL